MYVDAQQVSVVLIVDQHKQHLGFAACHASAPRYHYLAPVGVEQLFTRMLVKWPSKHHLHTLLIPWTTKSPPPNLLNMFSRGHDDVYHGLIPNKAKSSAMHQPFCA